ncbi:hypothetical protein AJOOGB_AJOOGB_12060, partial [Dysosmobacter welbionis]
PVLLILNVGTIHPSCQSETSIPYLANSAASCCFCAADNSPHLLVAFPSAAFKLFCPCWVFGFELPSCAARDCANALNSLPFMPPAPSRVPAAFRIVVSRSALYLPLDVVELV